MRLANRTVMVIAAASWCLLSTAFASEPYRVVADWPKLPDAWELGEVAGVAVDSHNHVFVFHRGKEHSILRLDAETGKVLHSFGDGLFINAHGLAIDGEDNVWVTDTRRHQVLEFSHEGELLLTLGEREVGGLDDSHFNQPTDVEITPQGEIFVTDGYGNNRVAKFSRSGDFLLEWGSKGSAPGEFNLPHGVALDPRGNVYVADRTNRRIQVFDSQGRFLRQWGEEQLGDGGRPWGLEIIGGRIYVIDGGNMNPTTPDFARLTVLDLTGKLIAHWSVYGREPGQLSWGHDLAVGRDGAVYTAEVRNNNRVQKFISASE